MANCKNKDKVLKRNGVNQLQRNIKNLNPENLKLIDFDVEDWILFTYNFANHINYFDNTNSQTPSDDWKQFFNDFKLSKDVPFKTSVEYSKEKSRIKNLLNEFKENGKLTPHLTLLVSFLQLLDLSKKRFNNLTKRHLDFYYKEILQVDKQDFTADHVHVIFELAKKSIQSQITENTTLNAKKDVNGKQLIYQTKEDLIVNRANVVSLKSIYNSHQLKEFKATSNSKTLDGLEELLPENKPYWYPFAYTSKQKEGFIELPEASIGFALASPLFNLKEGLRTIEITIDFEESTNLTKFNVDQIIEYIKVFGSGEEEWLTPITLLKEIKDKENKQVLYKTFVDGNQLKLACQLPKDMGALVSYNQEALLEKHPTTFPLLRFIIDTKKVNNHAIGFDIYQELVKNAIKNIQVSVDVRDSKSMIIANDFGTLKPNKPFYPFTSKPVKDSNFTIVHQEAFSKNWNRFTANLKWKNIPENFSSLYSAYTSSPNPLSFTAKKSIYYKQDWKEDSDQILFLKRNTDFESNIVFDNTNTNREDIGKSESVKLSLNQSFLHNEYPNTYALALINLANREEGDDEIQIPKEPYTPLAEEISIDYTASESMSFTNTQSSFEKNRIQLFHEHPFGQSEEHQFLKTSKTSKGIKDKGDDNTKIFLVPNYNKGVLFIGLENAEVFQNIALLIQVLEGSENPLVDSFKTNESIDWSILCDDKWKNLEDSILTDKTDNFLKSGIIKFTIPKEATQTNSILPEGLIWIRARMQKDYDAVCKFIDVHAQAVEATFVNNENALSHLKDGLPNDTISKLINRIPQIKSVGQPYNSFNGVSKESDEAFYRRISERLRHKNRAISLWDYEHLILQQFPEIYKVKCLNHTNGDNFIAAGHVSIVVIPDTVDKNVFDMYQPRVSKALLNKVADFVNKLNSMHIAAKIINPDYEEIEITVEAKFHIGYDFKFYQKQMQEDIIQFLSPWAFDDSKNVAFGIELHRSVLIDYLEKLEYVDYLQNIEIRKNGDLTGNSVSPTNPTSILVSSKKHYINPVTIVCKTSNEKETCQQ